MSNVHFVQISLYIYIFKQSSKASKAVETYPVDETYLGGLGYSGFFQACVSHLKTVKIICSPREKKALELLLFLEHAEHELLADISIHLIQKISSCISGAQQKLPSSAQGRIWSAFHQLRCNSEVHMVWSTFISRSIPAHVHCQESLLVLQLLMDRIMKELLENQAKEVKGYDDSQPV